MRHLFIINPAAGRANAGAATVPAIREAAAACGIEAEFAETKAPKDAAAIARKAAEAGGAVRLYSVGGDGTLNEVFDGARHGKNAEVACIPCGSGNDFIRAFGTAEDFLDIKSQIKGSPTAIDLIETDAGVSAGITSTGLDAEVAHNIPKYRRVPLLGGSVAYNLSIVERLLRPIGKLLRVETDGRVTHGRFLIATVCNAPYYGGGYCAGPMARMNDGLLEVILVRKMSRLLIPSVLAQYKKGGHWADGALHPKLRHLFWHTRCKEARITPAGSEPFILNVDGECGPAKRLYARALPGAARFVLPAALGPGPFMEA